MKNLKKIIAAALFAGMGFGLIGYDYTNANIKNSKNNLMPDLSNYEVTYIKQLRCPEKLLIPNAIIKMHSSKETISLGYGNKVSDFLSVTRYSKKNPFMILGGEGIYLDNGFNGGIPEDGVIDKKIIINGSKEIPSFEFCDYFPNTAI